MFMRISRLILLKLVVWIAICFLPLAIVNPVQADIAPPEMPPGSSIQPGSEVTQVQMVAETVLVEVFAIQTGEAYLAGDVAQAKVSANFVMRNQGDTDEQLMVRFPLVNPNGTGDGRFEYPEIEDLTVQVDRKPVSPYIVTTSNPHDPEDPPVKWAAFDVFFPIGTDVLLDVYYTLEPTGYLPYATFTYIMETGAGWKGPIGSADIIMRLPYEANIFNVMGSKNYYFSTAGGIFEGNDVRWHFEDFEPLSEETYPPPYTISMSIITPHQWQAVLDAKELVENYPQNGDAWGSLGRAYKLTILENKGWLRDDESGLETYKLSRDAYEKAISLAPNVAKWHAGYAELLWGKAAFSGPLDHELLMVIVQELKTALELDPNNQQAKDILNEIYFFIQGALAENDNGYDYLMLTTTFTPIPTSTLSPSPSASPTSTTPATPTQIITPTETLSPTREVAKETPVPPTAVEPNEKESSSNRPSVCGSLLILILLAFSRVILRL